MKTLIDLQEEAKRLMQRSFINLKKKGLQSSRGQIQARMELLEKRMTEIVERHKEILSLSSKAGDISEFAYFKCNFLQEVEEVFIDEKAKFLDALLPLQPPEKSSQPCIDTNQTSFVEVRTGSNRKLPPIEVPKFSGKYSEWSSFKDLFTSIIINDAALSNVERLQYLKLSLSGDAANLVKGIPITAENYDRAWNKLMSLYDNKRVLIHECLNEFFQLSQMTTESHIALKQLRDGTTEAMETLQILQRPMDGVEDFLVYITVQKFDSSTRRDWELSLDASSDPITWKQLYDFMNARIQALERSEMCCPPSDSLQKPKIQFNRKHQQKITSHVTTNNKYVCSCCQGDHYIAVCEKYRNLPLDKRSDLVSAKQLCLNCLGPHFRRECRSKKRCTTCNGRHHTLLHKVQGDASVSSPFSPQQSSDLMPSTNSTHGARVSVHTVNAISHQPTHMLLATANVFASSDHQRSASVRALIDPCSEASFIAESLAQRLQLCRKSAFVPVSGVGGTACQTVRTQAIVFVSPHFSTQKNWKLNVLVLPKLTEYVPSHQFVTTDLSFMDGLQLADPNPGSRQPIELIIGADAFTQIIDAGLRKSQDEKLVAQASGLGWILTGSCPSTFGQPKVPDRQPILNSMQCIVDQAFSAQLERFWKQEEVPTWASMLTADEAKAEEHFSSTHKRDEDGRYILRLPFSKSTQTLGDSRQSALGMLHRMENRFKSHPEFQKAYVSFMAEYEELGHMKKAEPQNSHSHQTFFLPHHGVFKTSDEKSKLRVVFNGSIKLREGHPVNDFLHIGPKLQTDIFDILLRWRMHRYVFTADIQKMFRQIKIDLADQSYQRILWRTSEDQEVFEYDLTTVTYGLASSPYQAVRTLHQLSMDESSSFPRAAKLLRENTYVDDIFAGADTPLHACELKAELIELLKAGGFPLGKWSANDPLLLHGLQQDQLAPLNHRTWQQFQEVQTLGISWQPTHDVFHFRFSPLTNGGAVTKRKCLSLIASFYDPMGWIAPVTIGFKIFMQSLWHSGLMWDDQLNRQLLDTWKSLLERLKDLHTFSVPRWTGSSKGNRLLELHCYSDASERAYAGCVYLRTVNERGSVQVMLLASKSKVAPLKIVSLPRLELCGAVLVVRLVKRIQEKLELETAACHLWTDSTIALSWIRKHPSTWKTYVANRVSEIQVSLPNAFWHHISGESNPSDLATRGLSSFVLAESSLWLHGPSHLTSSSSPWPHSTSFEGPQTCPEARTTICQVAATPPKAFDLLNRYSSLQKLLRVTSRCQLFIHRLRHRRSSRKEFMASFSVSELTPIQLNEALRFWISYAQNFHFSEDLHFLVNKKQLPSRSQLRRLNPIVDEHGILRVGGRLRHALLHPDEMNPMILPRKSYLTTLLIWDAHQRTLHGGTQLTLNHLRRKFWVLGGRQIVKSHIFKCMRCWRQRAPATTQLMGDLPSRRVQRCRPFLHSGIDFAGPINLRLSKGRGTKSYKGYIAVFVCLATRAVHLDVASGYSAEDFLQVYRRFVARRGICASLSSDCGTNFVGANKELRNLFDQARTESKDIAHLLANDGTEWRFNPPSAPHFGGIWEAAVKSVKMHLKRIIGETLLTFEEMYTLLSQIEACLNSRPLQPLSDDPSDISALTPAHFLIGTSTLTIPEPSLLDVNINRMSRWRLLRQMYEHFWRRWSSEYLPELQQRRKWYSPHRSVKVGDLCLVRSNLYPPCKWPLARIIDVKPGADGLVRVVHLQTATSTLVRPVTKISVLPQEEELCSPEFGEGGRDVPK